MADRSFPRKKGQIAIIPTAKCQLCETNDVQFKCFTCEEYMCKNCKMAHQKSRASRHHKITSIKGADQKEATDDVGKKCRSHPTEDILMFCIECRYTICMDCIASGSHRHHKLSKIEDKIAETQNQLSDIIDEAYEKLSIREDKIKIIRQKGNEYSKDVSKSIDEVKAKNVQLKSMVDEITDETIDHLQTKDKQNQDALKREESMVDNEISALREIINKCKERQTRREAELSKFIADVKNKLDKLQLSQPPSYPTPPVFLTEDVKKQKLKNLFGELDSEDEKGSDYERLTGEILTLKNPITNIKVVSTFRMQNNDIVAAINDTEAWIGYGGLSYSTLIASDGKVVHTVRTNFTIHDMAVTKSGDLLVAELRGNKVRRLAPEGTFTNVYVDPDGYQKRGITVTDDDRIIVGLYGSGKHPQSKLILLSPDAKVLQTIQFDSADGKTPLFGDPYRISCNRNGDVIIRDASKVVAVNQKGQKRFTYRGDMQRLNSPFDPMCTVTDMYGHILVSDWLNNAVHLLDSEGKFLQLILTDKDLLECPSGMSIDTSGRLWICSCGNDKVMVVAYLRNKK